MIKLILPNAQITHQLGRCLGKLLSVNNVVLLKGGLGAGKTTLVQGIGEGLNIQGQIVSPTFTLVNEYLDGKIPLYHLDLYRLSPEEVEGIYPENYWEGIEVSPGITVIEWAELLPYQPNNYLDVELMVHSSGGRQINLKKFGPLKLDFAVILSLFEQYVYA